MKENPLLSLMSPHSVAIVGAGNNPAKVGTIMASTIIKDRFPGKFYPVHPLEKMVLGHKAYPSVFDLPETPDLAVLIVPTDQVIGLMGDFGKIGTKRVVVISAGFGETGHIGRSMEKQLLESARSYGIRFLGPNCIGLINSEISLNITAMPMKSPPGLLGLASQSGTYVTQALSYLRKRGIRFSKAISLGNEADIDFVDAVSYLAEDRQTRAIALYIEGLGDPNRLLQVAREITMYKPIIAQYVGGTTAGARAASSHTGAIAGPDQLYDGLFKQAGIIRAYSIEDLYGQGWALATQPPLKGNRVGVITNSGGPGTAISNACNVEGLDVPIFSKLLQEQIRPQIPRHGSSSNPVDLTFFLDAETMTLNIPETIIQSGEVDGVILHIATTEDFFKELYDHHGETPNPPGEPLPENSGDDYPAAMLLRDKYEIPHIISSFFSDSNDYIASCKKHNLPVYDVPEKAAWAMAALWKYRKIGQRAPYCPPDLPPARDEVAALIADGIKSGSRSLDEFTSKKILALYGVSTSVEMLACSAGEAADMAGLLGGPVALKGCCPDISHKTGKGLIYLNLRGENAIINSYKAIQEAAGREVPVLVAKMAQGDRELIAGAIYRPGFGPCVMFGLGGIFTETLQDAVFRIAPLSRFEALEMLGEIKAKDLLGSIRGNPPVDRDALADILQKIGAVLLLHPEIREIDLNPIIIEGCRPIVVDALISLKGKSDA